MKKRNFKNKELQEFDRDNKQKKFGFKEFEEFIIDSLTESYARHSYEEGKEMTESSVNDMIKRGEKGLHNIQTLIVALFSMTQSRVIKKEHNEDFVLFVKRMVDKLYYSEVKKGRVNK